MTNDTKSVNPSDVMGEVVYREYEVITKIFVLGLILWRCCLLKQKSSSQMCNSSTIYNRVEFVENVPSSSDHLRFLVLLYNLHLSIDLSKIGSSSKI